MKQTKKSDGSLYLDVKLNSEEDLVPMEYNLDIIDSGGDDDFYQKSDFIVK